MEEVKTPLKHGFLSATALKTIAIVAMVIDHIAWAFVPFYSPLGIAMHLVGRITGITMFYFIAEGYHHTRNANRYTLRLLVFALVSYLPFIYFEYGTLPTAEHYRPFGVIYTLLLGLLALRARHELKNPFLRVAAVVGCILLSTFGDWPLEGVVMVLLFDLFYGRFALQALSVGAVVAFDVVTMLLAGNWQLALAQSGMFLPLLLLAFYNGRRGGGGAFAKWFFYIVYPAHLLVLGFLKYG